MLGFADITDAELSLLKIECDEHRVLVYELAESIEIAHVP